MKRERLQKLFSEDKEIFHGGMLFPTWICKGKEEIENRNIPQRAAVYLDIPSPCAGLLYYEKEKSLHYCEQHPPYGGSRWSDAFRCAAPECRVAARSRATA